MFRFGAPEWLPALTLIPVVALWLWYAGERRKRTLAERTLGREEVESSVFSGGIIKNQ